MAFAIFFTGDLLRECAFSSRTSAIDQPRRFVRLARLLAISPSTNTAAATQSIAEPAWDEKQSGPVAGSWDSVLVSSSGHLHEPRHRAPLRSYVSHVHMIARGKVASVAVSNMTP